MRAIRVLLGSLAGFVLLELLVFNTGFYAAILNPESSTGLLELYLGNETRRPVADRRQVLAIGDSRMGFFPRYANEIRPRLAYTYATISTPGSTPRCWYYMLRAVDPTARRYSAILIPVEDYDDAETWEDHANRITDLHYLIAELGWSDLAEYAGSYHDGALKRQVVRDLLFKGLVYKADFQDFLKNPIARLKYAYLARHESAGWYYDYVGTTDSVKDVAVDWKARTVSAPPGFPADRAAEFHDRLFNPRPGITGRRRAYLKRWFDKIYEHYRGSGTKLIFFRLPRGPFVRPDQPPYNPYSSVRELAAMPEVILDDEHYFDSLEDPKLFFDPMHMNAPGCAEFSRMLARRVEEILKR